VTEAEWAVCADPDVLLDHLGDRCTERKLRLFACVCCGPVWHRITEPACRTAVEVALRFADGHATAEELKAAHTAAQNGKPLFQDANWAAAWTAAPTALRAAVCAPGVAAQVLALPQAESARGTAWAAVRSGATEEDRAAAWGHFKETMAKALALERAWQAELFRELTGNPFHPTPAPEGLPAAVAQLAAALYEGEDCAGPLHDALEEAGAAELAAHFGTEEHPRGCWALDLLLGKK
jgi:hypothetical protein